jgi:pantoate--beta-alanine ligase
LALGAGTTLLFSPSPSEMYPNGEETRVAVPGLAAGLCGKFRPGHFEGVATVVAKFFNLIGEGSYFFGKKDYQQWKVIERLACDLLFPVRIVGRPTVREADGLAMSSRNVFLDERQRQLALRVPKALQAAIDLYRTIEQIMRAALESNDISVEYAEVRRAGDLSPLTQVAPTEPALAAIAVRLGSTRLIDNVVLAPEIQDLLPAPSQDGNPP